MPRPCHPVQAHTLRVYSCTGRISGGQLSPSEDSPCLPAEPVAGFADFAGRGGGGWCPEEVPPALLWSGEGRVEEQTNGGD